MENKYIDISGLNKSEVLAALYNRAKPLGLGILHFTPDNMSVEEAESVIAERGGDLYFDYHNGRVMKVDLSKESLYAVNYDRDNGEGAAQQVIDSLRR